MRASHVTGVRQFKEANVYCLKRAAKYGFLDYEIDENCGRKLFFHFSEIVGNEELKENDRVEFVLIFNKTSNRYAACSVRKIDSNVEDNTDQKIFSPEGLGRRE